MPDLSTSLILFLFILIAAYFMASYVTKKLERNKVLTVREHPFTHKKYRDSFYDVYRLLIVCIGFLYLFFFISLKATVIMFVFLLFMLYTFYRKAKTLRNEKTLISYRLQDVPSDLKEIDGLKKRLIKTKQVMITNQYIYTDKKEITLGVFGLTHQKIKQITLEDEYISFHVHFHEVKAYELILPYPKGLKKEVQEAITHLTTKKD